RALALQPDGKILVGGRDGFDGSESAATGREQTDHVLARFLPDGAPDPDFGKRGVARINLGERDDAECLALQPDGAVLAIGHGRPLDWIGGSAPKTTLILARYRGY